MTTSITPHVSYIGFHGKNNVGDDAIYDAVRSQLPDVVFNDVPRLPHEIFFPPQAALQRWRHPSTLVMGGGTLVGVRYFRLLTTLSLAITRNIGKYAIGVGVQDPAYSGRGSGSHNNELTRWAALLSDFRTLSVRGPRSAELLTDLGLSVHVSGDPALILPRPSITAEENLIGLNLGYGDDLWGHDPKTVAQEVTHAVTELSARGYRFLGIIMNPSDRRWVEMALTNTRADIVTPHNAEIAAQHLARCSVAIVSRLHAGVLAALSDTPVVALEYQPKCRDFALSLNDEDSLIRTDIITSTAVIDRVLRAYTDNAMLRNRKHAAVDRLRHQLYIEYSLLRSQLGLATDFIEDD